MVMQKVGQPMPLSLRNRGLLVVIEGMDGVGKSSLAQELESRLQTTGSSVWLTREPTSGQFGRLLRKRQWEGGRYSPLEEYWLFMLDRAEHGMEIRSHLAQGDIVLSDRYWHSTWVYQAPLLSQEKGDLEQRREEIYRDANLISPRPDIHVILDLGADKAVQRILDSRGVLDAFENDRDRLLQYRKDYLQLAQAVKATVLDAGKSLSDLATIVLEEIVSRRASEAIRVSP